jgi:hypothetical protein
MSGPIWLRWNRAVEAQNQGESELREESFTMFHSCWQMALFLVVRGASALYSDRAGGYWRLRGRS